MMSGGAGGGRGPVPGLPGGDAPLQDIPVQERSQRL